ncbi:hypothetical protein VM1G_12059 [Cytospora mali]|uniref:Uncharacterized protein n=1 Tax=Cytospora mali TaxID=578113 RepID=A0A194VJ77_CYTMA|nr:hypothetical protein VM1G_12059 [Valsa mali]
MRDVDQQVGAAGGGGAKVYVSKIGMGQAQKLGRNFLRARAIEVEDLVYAATTGRAVGAAHTSNHAAARRRKQKTRQQKTRQQKKRRGRDIGTGTTATATTVAAAAGFQLIRRTQKFAGGTKSAPVPSPLYVPGRGSITSAWHYSTTEKSSVYNAPQAGCKLRMLVARMLAQETPDVWVPSGEGAGCIRFQGIAPPSIGGNTDLVNRTQRRRREL